MDEPNRDELIELRLRLDRLERERRRWRLGALGGLLLFAGVAAAPRDKPLETERLVIRDTSGNVRAVLGVEKPNRGWPRPPASVTKGKTQYEPSPELGLFLYDADGAEVAHLTDWGGVGAYLQLAGREQKALASLSASKDLGLLEVSAKEKGLATWLREVDPVLKRAEREHWTPDDPRGTLPSLREVRTVVHAGAAGQLPMLGSVAVHSRNGLVAIHNGDAPHDPAVILVDQRGTTRAVLELRPDAGSAPNLELDGKVIGRAP